MRFARALVIGAAVVVLTSGAAGPPALLTEADLPPGWTTETVVSNVDLAMPTRGLCGGRTLASRAKATGGVSRGHVTFVKDPFTGPVLTESVWSFPAPKRAAAFLEAVRRAALRCSNAEHLDPLSGTRSTVTVTPDASNLTADRVAVAQRSASPSGPTTAGDSLYLRNGRTVVTVTVSGYDVDHALVETMARHALR